MRTFVGVLKVGRGLQNETTPEVATINRRAYLFLYIMLHSCENEAIRRCFLPIPLNSANFLRQRSFQVCTDHLSGSSLRSKSREHSDCSQPSPRECQQ